MACIDIYISIVNLSDQDVEDNIEELEERKISEILAE